MRRHFIACSFAAFILVVLLAAAASAADHRFTESFNTKQYCDKPQTTALWDTLAGELKLPPYEMTLTGTYNTAGNAQKVVVDGNFAYVADFSPGLLIINITNPASPTLAGSYNTPGSAGAVAVDGNYAYVADYASGLIVINITNPASPTLAGSYDTPGSARDVVVDGNYAYVADYGSGLIIVNITNPASPTLAGSYNTPGSAVGVAVAGNYAYVADGASDLQVINITNPASPTLAGTCAMPSLAQQVAVAGDIAYVAASSGGLQVIDISNPASPTIVGSLSLADDARGVAVSGDYAYVTDGLAGLFAVDISNPAAPSLMDASYNTPGTAYDVVVAGNQAFVADNDWGLQVINISASISPMLTSSVNLGSICYNIAIDGDYAFVPVHGGGLKVYDVSVPGLMTFVTTSLPWSNCYDVAIAGDVAYVADASDGLIAMNIVDPEAPTLLGTCASINATGVAVAGDYAYVADYSYGLRVINVTTPASPTLAGSCALPGFRMYGGVAIAGDYAYVASGGSGLQVVNISNPSSPTAAGSYDTPGSATDVAIDGDYAYVADGGSGLLVINITNPASPTLAGSYDTPGSASAVAVSGDYAYVADYTGGLRVINISNPASPTFVGYFNDSTLPMGIGIEGDLVYTLSADISVMQVYQRLVDSSAYKGTSLVLDSTNMEIAKARIAAAQSDSIKWEVSANNGTNWAEVPPNGAWTAIPVPGTDMLWRSSHVYSEYLVNPTCTQIEVGWLYQSSVIDSIRDIPGDQGGQARVYFARSAYDFSDEVTHPISTYYLWRRMDDPAALQAIAREVDPSAATAAMSAGAGMTAGEISGAGGLSDAGAPAGLPVVKWNGRFILRADRSTLSQSFPPGTWEIVGSAPGAQKDQYINAVPTLADSTVEGMAYAVYLVTAHTTTPSVWYASAPDSGYSVDNLAPHVPTSFAVAYNSGGGNDLSWDVCPDSDFEYFKVYRGGTEDFVPGPGNLVQTTIHQGWLDTVEEGYQYYYKIAAVDHAGNESAPASAGTVTGTDTPEAPKAFALHQNVPNPFNPTTRIRFDLPVAAAVRLAVYNVNGQMIRVLANAQMPAGAREVTWDGHDAAGRAAASGIYFYRLDAGKFTQTRKMILLR